MARGVDIPAVDHVVHYQVQKLITRTEPYSRSRAQPKFTYIEVVVRLVLATKA